MSEPAKKSRQLLIFGAPPPVPKTKKDDAANAKSKATKKSQLKVALEAEVNDEAPEATAAKETPAKRARKAKELLAPAGGAAAPSADAASSSGLAAQPLAAASPEAKPAGQEEGERLL